ncbi:SH3 domain-containing protein [Gemmatimonas sp.]|uniref:SH3 domain-containing protein n=1 Tax=Gemmatimonas sp. TaxID=1962908 RepID=UPI003F71B5EA
MHRVDSTCHWCGDVKSTLSLSAVSPAVLRNAAAVALMVTAAAGVLQYAPQLRDFATASTVNGSNAQRMAGDARVVVVAAGKTSTTSGSDSGVLVADSLERAQATLPSDPKSGADSITWTPAVARTWVNVRSDASRGGQVLGVIKPSSRAMLGTDRAGWRQVRSPDVSGWVDPRLFEADSLRTRGE